MDVIPAQDQTALSWLDMQAPLPVSYVSLGALQACSIRKNFLKWLGVWSILIVISKQKFLWVVRPGVIRGSQWLEPFPDGLLE